ncbi:ATP-binding protein [Ideonella sp. A 288]|uniref:ATP-binding response regulator n=1 Tax=Ideonella sp. A 288 TaxID=1962181 RepID=UPI000B4BE4A2|nr:ATP-binding protein [Ideonella sp. A 288]
MRSAFACSAALQPRHVLLVEDNPADADLTRELLEQSTAQRFVINRAPTLAAAIELLSSGEKVDAIILDLNLPDSQGIETVRRVRILTHEAPIIAISGHASDELRRLARSEGAEDLFGKQESNSRLFWRSVLQIMDRKRAQQRQFQVLLDAAPDGMVLANEFGQVRYVNQAAIDMFGRSREVLMSEPLGFSVLDAEPADITIPHPDGHRDCEMRVVRIEWDDEPVWLASVRDVTERKRASALQARSAELEFENRRFEAANRLKSEFLANMSHEFRTPLNAIIGFSQLLRDGVVSPTSPKHELFLGHILSSGRHLLQLINDVLDLAKVEAGKLGFAPEPVSLLELTEEVKAVLGEAAAKKGIDIAVEVDPTLVEVELDPGRFKQVLYNYLSNALKFTADHSQVSVRVAAEGEHRFRVEVRDNGLGIAPSDIAKLFTEFHQLDAGSARQHQGTGLGLALTKRLVEAQGGTVGVSSSIGHGSEFYAVLPRIGRAVE